MRSPVKKNVYAVRSSAGALFAEERQDAILQLLQHNGKVTVDELSARLGVSPPTVRTDLSRLESQGLLQRTHGGAILVGHTLYEPPYSERAILRQAEKKAIAVAAVQLVKEGETLILDAGTTCHEIALLLRGFRKLTVVTNSLASAQALAENDGIETLLVGGQVQSRRRAILGPLAAKFLEPFQCDRSFVAISGVHIESGFTVIDFDAAHLKSMMISKATQSVVVADSSKIGQISFACVRPILAVSLLITDDGISNEDRASLEKAGLKILIAGR